MGDGGFEPPKAKPADLQSVPFGHSGTLPNPTTVTIPHPFCFVKGKKQIFSGFLIFVYWWGKGKCKISLDGRKETCYTVVCSKEYATVAQQVEQLTRNEQVVRSNRISSSKNADAFASAFLFCAHTIR